MIETEICVSGKSGKNQNQEENGAHSRSDICRKTGTLSFIPFHAKKFFP